MASKITIGSYIPGNSWLHRLDVRAKILAVLLLITSIFFVDEIIVHTILLLSLILITISARIPIVRMLRGLRQIMFLLMFTAVLQFFTVKSGDMLVSIHFSVNIFKIFLIVLIIVFYTLTKQFTKFKFTYFLIMFLSVFAVQYLEASNSLFAYDFEVYQTALERVVYIFLRIFNVIIVSSLLTLSTSPRSLNEGIEYWLSPIPYIPAEEISKSISISLRMIPKLFDESTKILKAQASRGVEFSESSLKKKIEQIVSLLVPMLVVSLNISSDLADSMCVRGYVVGAKRTKLHVFKSNFFDIVPVLISGGLLVQLLFMNYAITGFTILILVFIYMIKKVYTHAHKVHS